MKRPAPTPAPTGLKSTTTARGFDHMESVPSEYGGNVRVSESSNASYAGVWVWAEEAMHGKPAAKTAINLTAPNAWLLGRHLLWLTVNHYQGDARPEEHFAEAHAALDAAITATEREHGDPQPTAEELLTLLSKAGFALVRVADAEAAR